MIGGEGFGTTLPWDGGGLEEESMDCVVGFHWMRGNSGWIPCEFWCFGQME